MHTGNLYSSVGELWAAYQPDLVDEMHWNEGRRQSSAMTCSR